LEVGARELWVCDDGGDAHEALDAEVGEFEEGLDFVFDGAGGEAVFGGFLSEVDLEVNFRTEIKFISDTVDGGS